MLKRIVIENYRSCLRTSIDFHPKLSVLIGPNSSGKTNILQAILFLNRMAKEEFERPHKEAITVTSRIKAAFQERGARVQLNASVDAYTDSSNNDVMVAYRQKWLLKGRRGRQTRSEIPLALAAAYRFGCTSVRYFYHVRRMRGSRLMKLTADMPQWAMRGLGSVAKYCAGIRYYGASQFTNPGSCPVSFEIEQEGKRQRLFRPHGHARILYNMYSAQKADANHRYKQFVDIVGPRGLRLIDAVTFREVPTSSTDYSVRVGGKVEVRRRHKLLVIPQFRLGRQKLSPNQLSEGTFKTLALLFHVITEDSAALLIEEPEVCVHHGLLSSILELVKSYSPDKREIEAWLLYDGEAIAAAFNENQQPGLPGNPESLVDPKKHLRDLIWKKYRKEYLTTVHNARIAKRINVSLLTRSASFTPHPVFTATVRRLLH